MSFQLVNFNSPEVRENSYQALGTAMKVVGEKPMIPFISDIDNIKQGKVSISLFKYASLSNILKNTFDFETQSEPCGLSFLFIRWVVILGKI